MLHWPFLSCMDPPVPAIPRESTHTRLHSWLEKSCWKGWQPGGPWEGMLRYPKVPLSSPSPSCRGLCWLWGLDVLGLFVWVLCAFNLVAKLYCKM